MVATIRKEGVYHVLQITAETRIEADLIEEMHQQHETMVAVVKRESGTYYPWIEIRKRIL